MTKLGASEYRGALLAAVVGSGLTVHCTEPSYSEPVPPAVDAAVGDGASAVDGASNFDPPRAANNRDYPLMASAIIDGASKRLHVIEYVIYPDGAISSLLNGMLAAAARGVEVKVLADEAAPQTAQALASLAAGGIDVRQDSPNTTTHNKLIIADDQILVGSHNFSHNAMEYNNEASVLLSDPRVAEYYEEYFQQLWTN